VVHVEIEEDLLEADLGEPVLQALSLIVVLVRMRNEDGGYGRSPPAPRL
jgi:hypothetical protein